MTWEWNTARLQTLRAFIEADPALAAQPMNPDGSSAIAQAVSLPATPDFIAWRSDVTADEIGNAWLGSDIDGMSALNMQRLQLLLASSPSGVFDMSRLDRRAGFENPFGANVNNGSRVAMRAVWKRKANRVEKLFATGTGSDASPATLTFEGALDYYTVERARVA